MLNLDRCITEFDKGLRTLFAKAPTARPYPDASVEEAAMSEAEKKHAAALMRINHTGEICAQALYQGQALTARDAVVQEKLKHAAWEETEHLAWTSHRVHELGGRLSLLNPFWYTGSLAIGAVAGALGDKWNLGFLAETERQVGAHLQHHLDTLPPQDAKSRSVAQQMYVDEVGHSDMAVELGAAELPLPVKLAMRGMSKVMTKTVYWV
ncbi:2-polyprenyl-3-methyl-6-methoxy-1,4-benzoquinone monooxygenase [Ferrigenium sp. UT5]|uniref:2-polyprenyl-3-methyl-6-methoxy-1,4-benzoquinone monooxygenase n=1 Tax=Ferrigenium sp. UT5 TaxID=3242105 RepID=UPI00354F2902